jgi:maltooligosyltrehalose trehalohydrolase
MAIAERTRLPISAEVVGNGVRFRVWAPQATRVDLILHRHADEPASTALAREDGGYFSATSDLAGPGTLYQYRLDGADDLLADPASRFQPDGPLGPSQVIDPSTFAWTDQDWPGIDPDGQVLYEMHVGTFTREGTWEAATRELPELARLGVTALEVMPVADFVGRFGWGYDGVNLFAPTRLYGTPDDFRRFVDRAHAVGLGVVLDVVYNHFGPAGCPMETFAADYCTDRYENEWGRAINFDGDNSGPVREYFVANAGYWIEEFHVDGLRLDATQSIHDASPEHVLATIGRRVREAAGRRRALLVAENEPQDVRLVQPLARGGYGLDGLWNDDLHHALRVALTGRNEAYYTDYLGSAQELVSAVKWGYLYQGQRYLWQGKRRGTPTFGIPRARFVDYLQNHDQVANSGRGDRVHRKTSPGRYRAATALLLLGPGTPLLFQGQEFEASALWTFFADHAPDLATRVVRGRREFMAQFPSMAEPGMNAALLDPGDPATFEACKLDLDERERHAEAYALHRDLLALRRRDRVIGSRGAGGIDGAVLGAEAFVIRFFGGVESDRLLLVNLGRDLGLQPAPEPLLAPPGGGRWRLAWSSEDPRYGGGGTPPLETEERGWHLPGHAAFLLTGDEEARCPP